MLRDRLAECTTLLRITNCAIKRCLADANCACRDINTPDFERAHYLFEAFTFSMPDQIPSRNGEFLKDNFAGIQSLVTELFELPAHRWPALVFLDREHADSGVCRLRTGVGLGCNREHRAVSRVRDEHL